MHYTQLTTSLFDLVFITQVNDLFVSCPLPRFLCFGGLACGTLSAASHCTVTASRVLFVNLRIYRCTHRTPLIILKLPVQNTLPSLQ